MGPAPHPDVAARGVPEPLEAARNASFVPLGPKVVGHVRLHRLEELDLVIVHKLQRLFCGVADNSAITMFQAL